VSRTQSILAALVCGTLCGVALRWGGQPGWIAAANLVLPLGQLWVRALQMTLVPLIFAMITHAVANAVASRQGGRLIGMSLGLFAGMLLVTIVLSTVLAETALHLWPIPADALKGLIGGEPPVAVPGFAAQLLAIIPENPVAAAAQGQIFPLVVFGLVLGIAIARQPRDGGLENSAIMRLLAETAHAMMQIVEWVLVAAPIGIFALSLGLGLSSGLGVAQLLGMFVVLCIATSAVATALCYVMVKVLGAGPVVRFAVAIAPAQAMAAGSCSSMASTPVMIEVATGPMGIPDDVVGLTIPMAVSLFRLGTAAHSAAVVLLAAHAVGLQPGPFQLVLAGLAVLLSSVSTAGLPGAAVLYACYGSAMHVLGAPLAIIPLYLAVVALVDPFITATNVTADLAVAAVVNRWVTRSAARAGRLIVR
jgi:Na+/H+-dicarboxylate symporter